MFNVHALQSGLEGWLSGAACRAARAPARARGCGEAGWGACIDVSPCAGGAGGRGGGCGEACQPGAGHMGEFRDRDIIVDEHGLHVLGRGSREGYGRILESAQKASAFGHGAASADALSDASTTHCFDNDTVEIAAREHFMRSISTSPWRSTEGLPSPGVRLGSLGSKRPLVAVGLGSLGIKRFNRNTSPKSAPQAPHGKAQTGMSKLWLGEAAQLPTLKDGPFKAPQSSLHTAGSRKTEFKLADLCHEKVIGKGCSATVWQATLRQGGAPLAVKRMSLAVDEVRRSMAVRELVTMYGLDHVGIVGCHNVFYSNNAFHMVMELMDGGSLLDAMKRSYTLDAAHKMPPAALATIAADILGALEFLHDELQVIHRDVKPGNILLSTSGQAKLGDLGIATEPGEVQVEPGAEHMSLQLCCPSQATEWIGTMTYMSPERLSGDCYSFSADIWSLGLVLVEAAIGRYPFSTSALAAAAAPVDKARAQPLEFWDLLDLVKNGACPSRLLATAGAEWASLQSLAAACLKKDGSQRPCAKDLLLRKYEVAHSTNGHFVDKAHAPALAAWVSASLSRTTVEAADAMQVESDASAEAAGGWALDMETGVHSVMDDSLQGLVDEQGSEAEGWL